MSKCLIATALKEIVDSEMDPDLISEILSSINTTLDLPGNSIEKYDISTIAICLLNTAVCRPPLRARYTV